MFFNHLSAHSLLAKTGSMQTIEEDEVGLKEKPEDEYIKIGPEAPGVRAKDLRTPGKCRYVTPECT